MRFMETVMAIYYPLQFYRNLKSVVSTQHNIISVKTMHVPVWSCIFRKSKHYTELKIAHSSYN